MNYQQIDYKTILIEKTTISFPKRIRQYEIFKKTMVVRISAKKTDPEYKKEFEGGNVFILNATGIVWQYDKKTITEIWKKDDDTLCMYDGQANIWVDVNKLEVVRIIWNPWGLDNPEDNV